MKKQKSKEKRNQTSRDNGDVEDTSLSLIFIRGFRILSILWGFSE